MGNIKPSNIPNRLRNVSAEHPYVAGAVDIYDDAKGKDQQQVNAAVDSTLDLHQSEINALDSQNYETYTADDQTSSVTDVLPATGEKDTVYRVGNWDGEQYDPTVYSEYAWDGSHYKLLDVKEYTLATADDFIEPDAQMRSKVVSVGAAADVYGVYEENPEFIKVCLDEDNKVIEAIRSNGVKVLGAGYKLGGSVTTIINSPEFFVVYFDNAKHILWGIQKNGNVLFGAGVPKQIQEFVANSIAPFKELFNYKSNPEFVEVHVDANDKLTEATRKNGIKFIPGGVETPKVDLGTSSLYPTNNSEWLSLNVDSEGKILEGTKSNSGMKCIPAGFDYDSAVMYKLRDPEFLEVKIDCEKKILSSRTKDGTKHEENLEVNHFKLTDVGMNEFQQALKDSGFNPDSQAKAKQFHLPKYGSVNIKLETFYLTADARYSDRSGVYLIQDLEDTNYNALGPGGREEGEPLPLSNFYIKSTLIDNGDGTYSKYDDGIEGHDVKLDFYAANKITKIEDTYYVTSTLEEGQPVSTSIEVTQIVDVPSYKAWHVEKKSEHYCLADIDFGYFYSKNNVVVGIKYQGQSTMYRRKRNLRVTFYKSSAKPYIPIGSDKFGKKEKEKFGELVRLSGYNLKANWSDNSRIKEAILYRIILEVWNKRVITDRFPWDKEFGYYTGATGFINGFPAHVEFGGKFFGLDYFALKKDEKNYMLDGDDDSSGMFLCGNARNATCWKHSVVANWDDEMMDEMSQETADELYRFLRYISVAFEGSDGNPYRWHELTYFVDGTAYDYSKVGNKDGKIYLYPEYGGDVITDIYVTDSLINNAPAENSITAEYVGIDKSEVSERMDLQGWIDYFICIQTFLMWDSICRNMILHTRSDKKKFYPYFYDLDLSLNSNYDDDIFDIAYQVSGGQRVTYDMTLWQWLKETYWDEIVNRYCELRNSVLNIEYITALYHDYADSIPEDDYIDEDAKWSVHTGREVFVALLDLIKKRLVWLDENYFIV